MLETLTLNNETAVRLVDKLKQFAVEYGCSGRGATYVAFGETLLNEQYLGRDPSLVSKILNRHGRINKVGLPFVADRIETKTNARIFGFRSRNGKLSTVKILMRHSGQTFATRKFGKTLFADVHARRIAAPGLKRAGPVFAPRVYDYDRKNGQWIVEDFVPGVRAQREEVARFAPYVDMSAIYGRSARMRPVFRRRATRLYAEWLASIDPEFPQPEKDAVWPESLIHSDLRGNLWATTDGRLCLIDWELAHVAPVANDFASIYYLNPDIKLFLFEWLRRLDPEGKALAPELQVGLALMRFTADMMQKPAEYVADMTKTRRISYEQAAKVYEEEKRGVREFLAFLRAPVATAAPE